MVSAKSFIRNVLLVLVLGSTLLTAQFARADLVYYRWSSAPAVTCGPNGPNVQATFASQPVEWLNVPVGATYKIVYLNNGAETPTGPFPLATGTGSFSYGAFSDGGPSYPLTVGIRLETIVNGSVVYNSTMSTTCTGNGATTSTVSSAVGSAGGAIVDLVFKDGRINNRDAGQTAAIYCTAKGSISIWVVYQSVGYFAFTATQQEIDAVPSNPPHNTLIKQAAGVALYRLVGGYFQVNGPDGYVFLWQHC